MPTQTFDFDLTTPQLFEAVPNGRIVNSLYVHGVPSGVEYFVKIGNNPPSGPHNGKLTVTFGSAVPPRDLREGVFIETRLPFPGSRLAITVSFAPGDTTT